MLNTTDTATLGERVSRLIGILRKITFAVLITPFIYTLMQMLTVGIALSGSIIAQLISDTLLYVSPLLIVTHLLYSRILRLCIWHRTACLLPLILMAVSLVDYFINFGTYSAIIINIVFFLMFGLLLVAAYNVFYVRR